MADPNYCSTYAIPKVYLSEMIKAFILRIGKGAKLNGVKEAYLIGYSKKLWTDKHKEMEGKYCDNYKRVKSNFAVKISE